MAFWDPIANAPRSQKILAGALLVAILGAGGYFLVLSPKMSEIIALRDRYRALQSELSQNRAIALNLSRFRAEAARLRERLEAAKERLPTEKEMPGLYRRISDLAFQAGLAVSLFQPKEPQPRDFYSEVPILIASESGFHQLGTFFDRVSRLPRVVTLTTIKLSGIEKAGGAVKADFTLATYFLRAQGATPPGPAAGKKQ